MSYIKLKDMTKYGLQHIETNNVVDGIIVPKTFGKLDIKNMSVFEARVNRFLLWHLIGHVNLPDILDKNFGRLAVMYNEFAGDIASGKEQTIDSLIKFEGDEHNADKGMIIGMLAGIYTPLPSIDYNKLDEAFIKYFKQQGIKVNEEK